MANEGGRLAMITTNERQENLIDEYGKLINPSKARIMREAGLGIIEERREGPYVWDQAGTRYIDCRDDNSLYNVGHRNPELVASLKAALGEYDLGNNLFFSEPRINLAKKLGELSPQGMLRGVAYGVSDGEINDFAIKLARARTGRAKVVALRPGTYGSTGFSTSANGIAEEAAAFGPLMPDFVHVPFDDIMALKRAVDFDTACVLLETVQSFAGLRICTPGFLKQVRALCDEVGALMIVDEVETGFGRTGHMFAIDREPDVVPDIMTVGNALGGGLFPITAAIFRSEYLEFWNDYPFVHHSSFAGSDLGCITGLAAIDYVEKKKLAKNAERMGRYLDKGFQEFVEKYPAAIRSFKRIGLMMAVEFMSDAMGPQMSRDLSQFGVLASYDFQSPDTMRILPALTINQDDAESILDGFDRALAGCNSIHAPMDPDVLGDLVRFIRTENAQR